MSEFLLALLVGVPAGILTGLIGSSGATVVVPGMILLGYTTHQGVGSSLAVDTVTSIAVVLTYGRHRNVNLRQGFWIALAAVLGAQGGSRLSAFVPEAGVGGGFGLMAIVSAVVFWRFGVHQRWETLQQSPFIRRLQCRPLLTGAGIGVSVGLISGLFGAGGGMIFMFALLLLGYELHQAIGTSTLIMAMTTASGAFGHALLGRMPYAAVAGAAAGAVLSGVLAARFANRIGDRILGKIMALTYAVVGVVTFVLPFVQGR